MGAAGVGGLGLVGTLVVVAVGYFLGIDVSPMVRQMNQGGPTQEAESSARDAEWGQFVSVVLADTEQIWQATLPAQAGIAYADPRLVMFRGAVQSACGGATAAMGPFYCPGDQTVYLDTDFFDMMADRMGAGGDFAAAYVIAHEVGHHVQNLTGTLSQVNAARARMGGRNANAVSVMTELQADCFAGVWARSAQESLGTLEEGDLNEAMRAANAVGDDVIQAGGGGAVVPDSFTHGSAADRQDWLMRGFRSGQMQECDTFAAAG